MLRPNTELTAKSVMQEIPRYVDISKGTLTGKDKRSEALNKAAKFKDKKIASNPSEISSYIEDTLVPNYIESGPGVVPGMYEEVDPLDINQPMMLFPQAEL